MVNIFDELDLMMKKIFTKNRKQGFDPCPEEEMISAYYEGNLEQKEEKIIENHLAICSQCLERLIILHELMSNPLEIKNDMMQKAKNVASL